MYTRFKLYIKYMKLNEDCRGEKGLQNPWREAGFPFIIRNNRWYMWNETNKTKLLKLFS